MTARLAQGRGFRRAGSRLNERGRLHQGLTISACRVQLQVTEVPCDCVSSTGHGVVMHAPTQGR